MKLLFRLIIISLTIASCQKSDSVTNRIQPTEKLTCLTTSENDLAGIVRGKKVKDHESETKDVLFILTKDSKTGDLQTCTASAIAPKILITAAHCIGSVENKTVVYFSRSAYCESGFNSEIQKKIVKKSILHPDYSDQDEDLIRSKYDLALLFLEEKIPTDYNIHSIATLDEGRNKNIEFLGYGVSQYNKDDGHILRKISIDPENIEIQKNHIYIHQKDGGICSGDSGGPGFIQVKNKKKILSVNSMIKRPLDSKTDDFCQYQALLTPLEPHSEWIKSYTKK